MRYLFLVVLLTVLHVTTAAQTSAFTGDWQGMIGDANLRLIFHFQQQGDSLLATLDSPDQGVTGLKFDAAHINGDTIHVQLRVAGASYKGILTEDKKFITGTWTQGGKTTPLRLKRGVTKAIRPQTPQPPYPYVSEEVEYNNKDNSVHFGATFTKPAGNKKVAAAIIISGSGTQDRNGTMFEHQPYAVLADYLTRNGIAVLRVDDRGAGKTNMGPDSLKVTSAHFALDVEAAIAYLQSRSDVDKNKIGLIGHSEGGMIAAMVAARNKAVDYVVLLAGPGQTGEAIWKYQMHRLFIKPGLDAAVDKKAAELVNKMSDALLQSDSLKVITQQMTATYKAWKEGVSDSAEKAMFKVPVAMGFYQLVNSARNGLTWLQYFLQFNPAPYLQKVTVPVLAVNGENDVQVTATENLAAIEAALKQGGNKKFTIKAFPGLNHLFQTAAKDQPYKDVEETFAPVALEFISKWIRQQTR